MQSGTTFTVDEIRASLAPDAILLEYYQAMGRLYVCVLGHDRLEIVPLGAADDVRSRLQLLQFQLAKFRRDPDNDAVFAEPLRAATEAHLRALYALLIAPIRDRLQASHLVVIPHDVLHTLPFHALFDGERFLIDDFTISYAPSASVHRLCWAKPAAREGGSLVMGVPDARAPFIADEVHAVAGILPDSQVFLGESATSGQLQRHGARSRFVHIATHGLFRKDNAMFSSIRLGDGPLSVYDLYQLHLSAELVTLSGCGTGLSVTVGGDEQLGLVRGLLYAGARPCCSPCGMRTTAAPPTSCRCFTGASSRAGARRGRPRKGCGPCAKSTRTRSIGRPSRLSEMHRDRPKFRRLYFPDLSRHPYERRELPRLDPWRFDMVCTLIIWGE